VSSKTATLRRRQAARQRQIKQQRKCGRVPQHTATERKRQALEREAALHRIRLVRRCTGFAFGTVAGGIMAGVLSLSPASAATPPAAQHNYYRAFVTGQAKAARPDRGELPHDDGPDITQDGFPAPYVVTGTAGYYPVGPGPLDDLLHNHAPEPTLYAGDASYGGTASSLAGLRVPRPAGARPSWDSPRYGTWDYRRLSGT
jgi:hypothetical protein